MSYHAFWHITPAYNADSILQFGIDPARSKGPRKFCWFVKWKGLAWALAHTSARHGIPVNQLVAIRVMVKDGQFTHHRLSMYYSAKVQRCGLIVHAGNKALNRWERQRSYYGRKPKGEARG